jgi:hypothetical protein
MLPYGKKNRPIYATASQMRAKENCGLVPFDFPSVGLRALFKELFWVMLYAAMASSLTSAP